MEQGIQQKARASVMEVVETRFGAVPLSARSAHHPIPL